MPRRPRQNPNRSYWVFNRELMDLFDITPRTFMKWQKRGDFPLPLTWIKDKKSPGGAWVVDMRVCELYFQEMRREQLTAYRVFEREKREEWARFLLECRVEKAKYGDDTWTGERKYG